VTMAALAWCQLEGASPQVLHLLLEVRLQGTWAGLLAHIRYSSKAQRYSNQLRHLVGSSAVCQRSKAVTSTG
jgi:hypothetical protein